MAKKKRFKARIIETLSISAGHLILEVVIKSNRQNLYRACFEAQIEKGNVPVKNNDFSTLYISGHYYGFGVRRKYINSHDIDWSECRLSEKLQRRATA